MVNIGICSEYNNPITLADHSNCTDTATSYPLFCTTSFLFGFYLSSYSSNHSKKSGVKYDRISVHPAGQG